MAVPQTWAEFIGEPGITFDEALTRWEAFVSHHKMELGELDCPLRHGFPEGLYTREITMPAGCIITSRIHNFDNPFFILKGKVTVLSENEGRVTYVGPCYGMTTPGTRRLLIVHEDTIWVTVHPNPENLRDIPTLENRLTFVKSNPYVEEKSACHSLPQE